MVSAKRMLSWSVTFGLAPPKKTEEKAPEEKINVDQEQYLSTNIRDAYYNVFCRGCFGTGNHRLLGAGHVERTSAYSHLVACLLFLVWSGVRFFLVDGAVVPSIMAAVSSATISLMFAVSTSYHVFGTLGDTASGILRDVDIVFIYITAAVNAFCDIIILSSGFDVSFFTILDALLASTVMIGFFVFRRVFVGIDESRSENSVFYRLQHSDLEHEPVRLAGVFALATHFLLFSPIGLDRIWVFVFWFSGQILGFVLLALGTLLDASGRMDVFLKNSEWRFCSSTALGCIVDGHAVWHLLSIAAAIVSQASREYAVAML